MRVNYVSGCANLRLNRETSLYVDGIVTLSFQEIMGREHRFTFPNRIIEEGHDKPAHPPSNDRVMYSL